MDRVVPHGLIFPAMWRSTARQRLRDRPVQRHHPQSDTGRSRQHARRAARVSGKTDGVGNAAHFNGPFGIALDAADDVYVAELLNNSIRKVTATGVVTTLAGQLDYRNGNKDGTGRDAEFSNPLRPGRGWSGEYLCGRHRQPDDPPDRARWNRIHLGRTGRPGRECRRDRKCGTVCQPHGPGFGSGRKSLCGGPV